MKKYQVATSTVLENHFPCRKKVPEKGCNEVRMVSSQNGFSFQMLDWFYLRMIFTDLGTLAINHSACLWHFFCRSFSQSNFIFEHLAWKIEGGLVWNIWDLFFKEWASITLPSDPAKPGYLLKRSLDPPNITKTHSQEVFGCLGMVR